MRIEPFVIEIKGGPPPPPKKEDNTWLIVVLLVIGLVIWWGYAQGHLTFGPGSGPPAHGCHHCSPARPGGTQDRD